MNRPTPRPSGARRIRTELESRDRLVPAKRIARMHGVHLSEMFGRSCQRHVVACRRTFYRFLVDMAWSPAAIGRLVSRNHATLANALHPKRRHPARTPMSASEPPLSLRTGVP
jgi:hypothetical protein